MRPVLASERPFTALAGAQKIECGAGEPYGHGVEKVARGVLA